MPLVKMTEHMNDRHAVSLRAAMKWRSMTPGERLAHIENQEPLYADVVARVEYTDIDVHITTLASIWANGASDHLIDLDLGRAPASLRKLRSILLELRYIDTDKEFTDNQWNEIKTLWKESAMDIDEDIGATPVWGEGDYREA